MPPTRNLESGICHQPALLWRPARSSLAYTVPHRRRHTSTGPPVTPPAPHALRDSRRRLPMRRRRIARRTDHRPSRSAASCPQRPALTERWALARSPPTLASHARHARARRAAPPVGPRASRTICAPVPSRRSVGRPGTRGRGEGGATVRAAPQAELRTRVRRCRFDARGAEEGAGGGTWSATVARERRGGVRGGVAQGARLEEAQPPLDFPFYHTATLLSRSTILRIFHFCHAASLGFSTFVPQPSLAFSASLYLSIFHFITQPPLAFP